MSKWSHSFCVQKRKSETIGQILRSDKCYYLNKNHENRWEEEQKLVMIIIYIVCWKKKETFCLNYLSCIQLCYINISFVFIKEFIEVFWHPLFISLSACSWCCISIYPLVVLAKLPLARHFPQATSPYLFYLLYPVVLIH